MYNFICFGPISFVDTFVLDQSVFVNTLETRNIDIDPTFSIEASGEVVKTTLLDKASIKSGKFG